MSKILYFSTEYRISICLYVFPIDFQPWLYTRIAKNYSANGGLRAPPEYIFNLHFWIPHNLHLKNFVVPNGNFYPIGVKTGILRKRKYDFSCQCPHFYVIKNSIYTYRRKFILNLNKRWELILLIHEKSLVYFLMTT